jgi:hypothetical protein
MFCPSCGTNNLAGTQFCGNCGVGLDQPTAGPSYYVQPEPAKPNFFKSRNGLIAMIAAGVLVVGSLAAVVVNLPKTVNVKLAVTATNGGVFTPDCEIQSDATSLTPKFLTVKNSSNGSVAGLLKLKYVTGVSGGCVGEGQVSLNPNATYAIDAEGNSVGSITSSDFSSGVANVGLAVAITRTVKVAFSLYDTADYCSGTTESWHCSWDNDYIFGLSLTSSTGKCEGQNGYNDISDGTTVTMVGRSNHQTFTGSLTNDTYDLVSVSSKQIECKFNATFNDVPNDDLGYSIEVSHRGFVDYNLSDIRENDWTAKVALNQ